jgi:hypothetical protein
MRESLLVNDSFGIEEHEGKSPLRIVEGETPVHCISAPPFRKLESSGRELLIPDEHGGPDC